jgi:hypothetical protein
MVLKKYRQTISNCGFLGNRCFEKQFLHVSGKVGPKLEGCVTQQAFELAGNVPGVPVAQSRRL